MKHPPPPGGKLVLARDAFQALRDVKVSLQAYRHNRHNRRLERDGLKHLCKERRLRSDAQKWPPTQT
jgi:hypothetical protein